MCTTPLRGISLVGYLNQTPTYREIDWKQRNPNERFFLLVQASVSLKVYPAGATVRNRVTSHILV